MICEECGCKHQNAGSRFCSTTCRHRFVGKQSNKNGKLTGHAPTNTLGRCYNNWKCPFCKEVLSTKKLLKEHKKEAHPDKSMYFIIENGHRKILGQIWNKGLRADTDERVKGIAEKLSKKYKSGELIGFFTGKTHSESVKKKISKSTLKYIQKTAGGPRFNLNACKYFDKLNKDLGWNLQHALNGGEVRIGRYALDAYDKDRNIVVEYDEHRKHYTKGKRSPKDIVREQRIKDITGCKFYRYLEFESRMIEV